MHVFWAPFQHFLCSTSKVFKKPDTTRMHAFFSFIRNAYPVVRSEFNALVDDDNISPITKSVLVNLIDMFEYYLPLVCTCFHLMSVMSTIA